MTVKLLQAACCLFLCPVLVAQQVPATAVNSNASQTLPDNPAPHSADAGGWTQVGDLARGDEIMVTRSGGPSIPCRFAGATNGELFCESLFSEREMRFNRSDIEKVRMDQSRRDFWVIIGGGAVGVGLWAGISSVKTHDSGTAVAEGVVGTAVGAFLAFIPAETVRAFHLIPGRLVYRRTARENSASTGSMTSSQAREDSP
jgi:hypothetical protein